jgi:hypothetical protein
MQWGGAILRVVFTIQASLFQITRSVSNLDRKSFVRHFMNACPVINELGGSLLFFDLLIDQQPTFGYSMVAQVMNINNLIP